MMIQHFKFFFKVLNPNIQITNRSLSTTDTEPGMGQSFHVLHQITASKLQWWFERSKILGERWPTAERPVNQRCYASGKHMNTMI